MKELKVKRRGTYIPIRNLVLRSLVAGSVISAALVAPKVLTLIKEFDKSAVNRKNLNRRITQAITRLEQAGLIHTSGTSNHRNITLTKKGQAMIGTIYAHEYSIPEPAFWDGKWRMVIFDIREKRRKIRSQLRALLSGAGFLRLQDSVWVHPYPCDEFISLIRTHLKSGTGEMLFFIAEALEADKKLREYFQLL